MDEREKSVIINYFNGSGGIQTYELKGKATNTGYKLDDKFVRVWCPVVTLVVPIGHLISLEEIYSADLDEQRSDGGDAE